MIAILPTLKINTSCNRYYLLIGRKDIVIAGTSEGARKALETKRQKYGVDSPSVWGRKGGLARNVSPNRKNPFSADREFAREMGRKSAKARWNKHEELSMTEEQSVA